MKRLTRNGGILAGLLVGAVVAFPAIGRGESAAEAFANGKALLAKSDFNGALAAFSTAVRSDESNRRYATQYTMVRRIIQMRKRLESETDPERQQYMAEALRSFYMRERIYPEALALDRKAFKDLKDSQSAVRLGETLLTMNENAEAAEVLSEIDASKATETTKALLGVALARQRKLDQAKSIAKTVSLPKDPGPGVTYAVARLYAATGDSDEALRSLTRCFESIRPSLLEGVKAHARLCPEFADLASTDGFVKVLQTKSKVAESKCSSGSKCSGCPMRQSCKGQQ